MTGGSFDGVTGAVPAASAAAHALPCGGPPSDFTGYSISSRRPSRAAPRRTNPQCECPAAQRRPLPDFARRRRHVGPARGRQIRKVLRPPPNRPYRPQNSSKSTALKVVKAAIESSHASLRRIRSRSSGSRPRMWRLHHGAESRLPSAGSRFSQPAHVEQQQQHPDHELQPVQRHPID